MIQNVYVMMFGIANIVAGGPIYNANKIRYLEERGWKVVVFPVDTGDIYIKPLEKYNKKEYAFIRYTPYLFGHRRIEKFLDEMESVIPRSGEIIVETGTDYTALWGELLAKRLGAKHVVFFLDEKNERVNEYSAPFYEFKYKRKELASITEKSLLHVFSPYFKITNPNEYVINAWCTNSVGYTESDFVSRFPKADYMIGSIGRLEKSFVPSIIEGVCEFADEYNDKTIGLSLFGGSDKEVIENIKKVVSSHSNIRLFISGYIWPIPASVFDRIDIFISGAGAAFVSADMGVTTVSMDVIGNMPLGYISDATNYTLVVNKNEKHAVVDYLRQALIQKDVPSIINRKSIEEQWDIICDDFDKQMDFIERSKNIKQEYFPVETIWNHSFRSGIKKILIMIFPLNTTNKLRSVYSKVMEVFKHDR